jgi:hypothetical protein
MWKTRGNRNFQQHFQEKRGGGPLYPLVFHKPTEPHASAGPQALIAGILPNTQSMWYTYTVLAKGYKDGLQPESLADGVLANATKGPVE